MPHQVLHAGLARLFAYMPVSHLLQAVAPGTEVSPRPHASPQLKRVHAQKQGGAPPGGPASALSVAKCLPHLLPPRERDRLHPCAVPEPEAMASRMPSVALAVAGGGDEQEAGRRKAARTTAWSTWQWRSVFCGSMVLVLAEN